MSNQLPWSTQKEVIEKYISGQTQASLAEEYGVTRHSIANMMKTSPKTNAKIEKDLYNTRLKWENDEIMAIKTKYFKTVSSILDSLDEVKEPAVRVKLSESLDKAMVMLDKQWRLNNQMATEKTESSHTEKKVVVDVAKILKELDSPEKQQAYFLKQIGK